MARLLPRLALLALACTWAPVSGSAAAEVSRELDVKAALLYNLTQFVEWPPEAFTSQSDPLVIGILGRDPFGETLDRLVSGESVEGRPITVARLHDTTAAARCHLLFVSASEQGRVASILQAIEGHAVLTVADFDGFLRAGGVVQLYRNNANKVRVQVNLATARAARLTLSAKLLRVVELYPAEKK